MTERTLNFSIPFIQDLAVFNKVVGQAKKGEKTAIKEMYLGNTDIQALGLDRVNQITETAKEEGIEIAVTATIRDGHEINDQTLKTIGPDRVITGTYSQAIDYHKLGFKIYLSTILGIENDRQIERIVALKQELPNITDMCFHHDSNMDPDLADKIEVLHDVGIATRVMVTESCYSGCLVRANHYMHTVHQEPDSLQSHCVLTRHEDPALLLDLAGFILPEEIRQFQDETNIDIFKITGRGRGMTPELQKSMIETYLHEESPTNIADILVYTYAKGLFFIDRDTLLRHSQHLGKPFYRFTNDEKYGVGEQMKTDGTLRVLKPLDNQIIELGIQARKKYGHWKK